MDIDSTMAWCTDLSVDPNDAVFFVLAELARAPKFGYFDRKPWIEGWQKASGKPDTVEKQKKHIKELKSKFASDGQYFTRVYAFCFEYAKEPGQKSLCAFLRLPIPLPMAAPGLKATMREADNVLACAR